MDSVNVSLRGDGETSPLFVQPKDGNNSVEFLKAWIGENKEWIDQQLLDHGAVLFRGFDVGEGVEFQELVQQYNPDLSDQYRGTSPRKLVPGTKYVFSASELPPFFPIPQHLEMAFLAAPPRKLFFCCLVEPTSLGGETCLCDFKKVYDQMDPEIRREFEEKGVLYSRNYNGQKTFLTDPTMLKGWQDVYETRQKGEVEEELRRTGLDYSWGKRDSLRIVNREAAIEPHPLTGEKIWFNHSQVFHWSMIPDEYYKIYQHFGVYKYLVLSWLTWLIKILLFAVLGPNKLGFHTSFGDGTEIPEGHLKHVRDVIWKNMVFNRWKNGDLLMIDNFRMSHGRQPFSGQRKIVVSWSQPHVKPSRQHK